MIKLVLHLTAFLSPVTMVSFHESYRTGIYPHVSELSHTASELLVPEGPDHVVYMTAEYDATSGQLDRVDLYDPPIPMSDSDFELRTEAYLEAHPNSRIGAFHAIR